ncbi:MAG: hypothetical protein EBE86_002310 [Hormoscilla sp. GUM202]|nr:hypothetical protein [Hormoscilla sp. GUM202]
MENMIITIFVLCDELLKALNIKEDPQVKMTNAEVMTVGLVAAYFFGGHHDRARQFMAEHNYIKNLLSKSRLNLRLHKIDETTWMCLFQAMAQVFKELNPGQEYIIESFPVPVCDNIRIDRCKIYTDRAAWRSHRRISRIYRQLLTLFLWIESSYVSQQNW